MTLNDLDLFEVGASPKPRHSVCRTLLYSFYTVRSTFDCLELVESVKKHVDILRYADAVAVERLIDVAMIAKASFTSRALLMTVVACTIAFFSLSHCGKEWECCVFPFYGTKFFASD